MRKQGKTIREYFCTFLSQIERGVDDTVPLESDIIPWIVRWVAICYPRYKTGTDGRTSYERRRGRSCKSIVVPIGETVHYKELGDGGDRQNKAESEWSKRVWLGPGDRNTETLIGTSRGVVRAHTVERLTPSTKWDINYILDMKGAPQRPDPSKPGLHIPVRIRLEPEVTIRRPETRLA